MTPGTDCRKYPLFQAPDPARVSGGQVTFEPGARTAWHTHPLGQTLIITSGLGWIQREGGSIEEVRPGDVVWFPPGLKHWHGASPTTAMTHIAIQESLNGKNVDWMEKVSDEQYRRIDSGREAVMSGSALFSLNHRNAAEWHRSERSRRRKRPVGSRDVAGRIRSTDKCDEDRIRIQARSSRPP